MQLIDYGYVKCCVEVCLSVSLGAVRNKGCLPLLSTYFWFVVGVSPEEVNGNASPCVEHDPKTFAIFGSPGRLPGEPLS
jgi:hypothetical protein